MPIDPFLVKVARLGDVAKEIAVPEGATVSEVLENARISLLDGETLQINGDEVDLKDTVNAGDTIFVVPPSTAG